MPRAWPISLSFQALPQPVYRKPRPPYSQALPSSSQCSTALPSCSRQLAARRPSQGQAPRQASSRRMAASHSHNKASGPRPVLSHYSPPVLSPSCITASLKRCHSCYRSAHSGAKPDMSHCSCRPAAQTASDQPFQPARSSDVRPTVMPAPRSDAHPWRPLLWIGP